METTKNQFRSQAFVLTPVELTRICSFLPADIRVELICKDGIERKYRALQEFLEFEHPKAKQISELTIRAYSEDLKNTTTVIFKNRETPFSNLIMLCKGEEEYVSQVSERLNDRFAAMQPWYWWLAKWGWTILFAVWLLVWLLASFKPLFRPTYTPSNLLASLGDLPIGVILIVLVATAILIIISWNLFMFLQRFINYAFPMGVFAIGQGTKRHSDREKWRQLVIVGFVINIIAGFVVWFITR